MSTYHRPTSKRKMAETVLRPYRVGLFVVTPLPDGDCAVELKLGKGRRRHSYIGCSG